MKTTLHVVPKELAPKNQVESIPATNLRKALTFLLESGVVPRYGDLVTFGENNYRNENKAIFNGTKFVNLEFDESIDEYGYLPRSFRVIENGLPIEYWCSDAVARIEHNNVVWFDHSLVRSQLKFSYGKVENSKHSFLHSKFKYAGKEYYIVVIDPSSESDYQTKEEASESLVEINERFGGKGLFPFYGMWNDYLEDMIGRVLFVLV